MTANSDKVELARLQKEIKDALGLGSENILFEYRNEDHNIRLDLITINPRHNQSFLFHTTMGMSQVETLQKMLEYVKGSYESDNTFTIQWTAKGESELHTSYFRARNIMEALDKLYFGRDIHTIIVYSAKLNPIT